MSSFTIKKSVLLPTLAATLLDENGNAVDLTGAAGVVFRMKRVGDATYKVNAAGSIVSAVLGTVSYVWAGTDTDTQGDYEAEWVVSIAGKTQVYPGDGSFLVSVFLDDISDPAALVFCTVAQARTLLRVDLDVDELALAQTTISIRTGVPAETSLTTPTYYDGLDDQDILGLRQATAFQAKWLRSQFDFLDRMNLADESADGESRSYRGSSMMLAPWAEWALNNTRFSSTLGYTIDTPRAGVADSIELYPGLSDERTWRAW